MPRVKKYSKSTYVAGGCVALNTVINVSAQGEFYCDIEERYSEAATEEFDYARSLPAKKEGFIRCTDNTLDGLERKLYRTLALYAAPEIEEYPVILYHIAADVSFAQDDNGNIFPNAGFPGARWPVNDERKKYGDHHASAPAKDGYSLTVGACAKLKKIVRFGSREKVTYENYYKGESHLGSENAAQRLNSWVAFSLPDKPREMPYSDEAAMFFYELMMGMARLAKLVQDHTWTEQSLLESISRGGLLQLAAPEPPEVQS